MSQLDLEDLGMNHSVRMFSGCESITNHISTSIPLSENGQYAFTVLKLEAKKAGLHSGSESYIDYIKKGAKSTAKWIFELLKQIRDYFFGGRSKKVKEVVDSVEKAAKTITTPKTMFGSGITQTLDIQANFTVSKSAADEAKRKFNALPTEVKKEVEEEFKEKVASLDLNEIGENTVNKIKSSISAGVESLIRPAEEIKRIGLMEGSKLTDGMGLGDEDAWVSIVNDTISDFKHMKVTTLTSTIKHIATVALSAESDLKEATNYLDKLSKTIGDSENQEEQRKLNRAVLIISEFTKIVSGYQKLVVAINSALTKTIRAEQDKVIANILRKNKINIVALSNQYDNE